ncbi:hypothetical protein SAMN05421823_104256 [Catalinimonas alkaloidigena]|uniref:Uncharacterized protein n=1 Tax=Catalinimonas alkaloidigena TaxID=1075417 RepID=A0A1G9GY81_9BACT|nr:hypothetical protein [Catalinimonas alkaloidigena]SDL05648.1 hypothetical protein SAMN05421823_104256 [Catalinimonas alkaloidigena]
MTRYRTVFAFFEPRVAVLVAALFLLAGTPAWAQETLKLNLRVWLEGAYQPQADTMRTDLQQKGVLATYYSAQGDSISPIGQRMASGYAVPARAVDVVKLELRTDPNVTTPLATGYAWLLNDGTIRDFKTGQRTYAEITTALPGGNYYVVIKHRNHLPVMSAEAIWLSTSSPETSVYHPLAGSYDLGDLEHVYGAGAKPLSGMRYGMIAGDGYQDSRYETNANDFNQVTAGVREGIGFLSPVYDPRDVDLSGEINARDYKIASRANDALYFAGFKAGQP